MAAMAPRITSITPLGEGACGGAMVAVHLRVPVMDEVADTHEAAYAADTHEAACMADARTVRMSTERVCLLLEQYAVLRLSAGEISLAKLEAIREAGRLTAAIRRGLTLLQYGDRSARRLTYQLTAKGIDRASAEAAVAYLSDHGYIREDSAATRRAEQSVRKLWGPRRIREDLRAAGYSPDAIEDAMAALEDVDFEENCLTLLRKKSPAPPTDRAARQKLMAAVMRMGYEGDMVRRCMNEMRD